jgi:hypothetical protein
LSTPARDERREQELARGQQVAALQILSERFNPDHVPETHPVPVSKEERRRRDEYRQRMGAQVQK